MIISHLWVPGKMGVFLQCRNSYWIKSKRHVDWALSWMLAHERARGQYYVHRKPKMIFVIIDNFLEIINELTQKGTSHPCTQLAEGRVQATLLLPFCKHPWI